MAALDGARRCVPPDLVPHGQHRHQQHAPADDGQNIYALVHAGPPAKGIARVAGAHNPNSGTLSSEMEGP
jgi:hypothetical protein